MSDLETLDLQKDEPEPRFSPGGGGGLGGPLLVIAALIAVAGGGYWAYTKFRPAPPTRPSPQSTVAPTPATVQTPTPPPLPPLAESDGFIRDLLKAASPDPHLAEWLGQDNLVRRFATVVDVLADGGLPTRPLAFLAPKSPFMASERGGRVVIDPRTYARYDAVADVIASLDAATCARVYGWVVPLLDEAYKDLGHPQGGVENAVAAGFAELLGAAVPPGEIALTKVEKGHTLYVFTDPDLEALSPAQKALVRMGPSNAAKVQAKLAELRPLIGQPASSGSAAPTPAPPASPPPQ